MNTLFIIKKFISSFLMPLSISLIISIIGLYLLYKNRYKVSKIFLAFGITLTILFSYTPIGNTLLKPLENSYKKIENIDKSIKYILLLGGDINNRGWEVLRLYNKLNNCKVITSGYAANGKIAEAVLNAKILEDSGIKKENIIINDKAKDTIEESIYLKKILQKNKFYLVTSAYHMPRAIMIFKNNGLNPIAAPTNFMTKDKNTLIPSSSGLKRTEIALHEYLGILWYKINHIIK